MHATITLIEIEMYGKGDGGPREGTEEWPEMSRRGSGVRVTESLWGGMSRTICHVEESAKDGLGQGERMGMGKKKMPGFDGRWTVTAT